MSTNPSIQCPACQAGVTVESSSGAGNIQCGSCKIGLWYIHTSTAGLHIYKSADVAPVQEKILEMIGKNLGVNKEQVTWSTSFVEGLGADSLDIAELIMDLEEEFKVTIPDEEAEKIKTVGDAVDYIMQHRP